MSDIVYIQYTNPAAYPPLQHSSRIFAKAGKKVLFLGTGASGKANAFEFPLHENIKVWRWNYCKPGIMQKIHYICFSIWACTIAWVYGAKWIYASDMFSCPAALIAKKIFGLKIVYHEHDSPSSHSPEANWFNKVQLYFRGIVARCSDIVIFPNKDRAEIYRQQTKRLGEINIIWNVPSLEEIKLFSAKRNKEKILFYHGSLNEILLPVSILDALSDLDPDISLVFAGYSAGLKFDYAEWYLEQAKIRGLEGRVRYLGSFSRKDLLDQCSNFMVGLALFPESSDNINIKFLAGASNKVFDYLACGLDLIITDTDDWRFLLAGSGVGYFCNSHDVEKISNAMKQAINKRISDINGNYFLKVKSKVLQEWNYENQFHNVYQRVVE
jgi:glycosyltransferase involved in cell wall biosynthesis